MEGFCVLAFCAIAIVITGILTRRTKPFDWLVDETMMPWIFF